MIKFFRVFFLIFSIKILFFLPPPHTITFQILLLTFDNKTKRADPIILAVKSVNVAAPSSSDKPLAKETSKSFTSNDKVFLFGLFPNNSCACSNIISFLVPLDAKIPSLSNFKFEFFLIQESIKQFPGPISLLVKPNDPVGSPIIVMFDIPPIFKIHVGKSKLYFVAVSYTHLTLPTKA